MKSNESKYSFDRAPSMSRRTLYTLLAVLVFFGGIEAALRVVDFGFYINFSADLLGMPLLDMSSFRRVTNRTVDFDPHLFWKFKPDQVLDAEGIYRKPVVINSHGFRGKEFSGIKPEGTFRIICLGDSSTFGWSVGEDETYPYYLERILREKYKDARFEVLNLGVTGYSSRQGRELFSRIAMGFEPDMVVFAFGPNDRLPALKSDSEHLRDRTWAVGRVQVFLNRIQLYKLIKSGVIYVENRSKGLSLDPATYIPKLKRKVNQEEFRDNAREVEKLCDGIGAGMILVNVDYPSEPMDPAAKLMNEEAKKAGVKPPSDWNFWDSSALVQETAGELDVASIDIRILFSEYMELLQKGEGGQRLAAKKRKQLGNLLESEPWRYIMVDNGHPDKWGHELIANALIEKLEAVPGFSNYIKNRMEK